MRKSNVVWKRLLCLSMLSAAVALGGIAPARGAPAPPKKIAVLVADWFPRSHPDVIVSRIFKTYALDGKGQPSRLKVVSVFSDQPGDRDLSATYAKEYGFNVYDSVAAALTLGGDALAVDGVILSTEWSTYPVSPTGQTMYPHRRMFEEIVRIVRKSGRAVPVFIDKHLADTWRDSKWIYDTARELGMPLMAGSSLPVVWRRPAADVDPHRPLKEIVGISYHTLDGYGFHGMEMVQTLAERRMGGETGIASVQCLVGDAVWAAAGKLYDPELLAAAASRLRRQLPEGKALRDVVKEPVLFVMDCADGLRVSLFTLNGWAGEWTAAWRYADGGVPESTLFQTDDGPRTVHFANQMMGVEQMMLTGIPSWPVERTLLTSGALDALLISKKESGKRLETPYLHFPYTTDWVWDQPPDPRLAYGAEPDPQDPVADPVFDLMALDAPPLNARTLKRTEEDGIVTEEVMFHSETDGETSVDIFALFCYPKGARKLPAFVWNQAGAGKAGTYFPLIGARRGYAALCTDLPQAGYRSTGGYSISSGVEVSEDPRQAGIYHAAVSLFRAVSFLRSREEVDPERIGMAGSSWGGFFTTMMIGIDPRLKCGSAMFGSGSMQLGNGWWDAGGRSAKYGQPYRQHWRMTLDPAMRLCYRKTPMGWFTGTNDGFYWMPAVMRSYHLAAGPTHLTLLPNWDHGLTPEIDEQVFAWLDAHLKDGPRFPSLSPVSVERRGGTVYASWTVDGAPQVTSADLVLSYGDAGNWSSRYWKSLPARVVDGVCTVTLPASTLPYYIGGTVTDPKQHRYSTPLLRIDPGAYGLLDPSAGLDYDGCSEWGSFEEACVWYLKALGLLAAPEVSADARQGKQALVVRGRTILRALYFTSGVAHRFSCSMKAAEPAEVGVELKHTVGGDAVSTERTFQVGTEWRDISLDYDHARTDVSQALVAIITPPDGGTVLVDDARYVPLPAP